MMSIPFMYMSDLSALLLLVLYFPLCFFVLWIINRILKKVELFRWARIGFLSSLFLVMFICITWDSILAKYYLDKFCEKDGGISIHKMLKTDGFYMPERFSDFTAKKVLNKGYVFFEMDSGEGGYVRYQKKEGNLQRFSVKVLLSEYKRESVSQVRVGTFDGIEVKLNYSYIANVITSEKIAEYKDYYVSAGYLDQIWAGAFGGGYISCSEVHAGNERFTGYTFGLNALTPK